MKKVIVLSVFLVAVMFVLSGCGEKAAEKAIETSTGEQADVDIDNDTVSVNTNEGSMQVGEEVDLPDDFPSDVYVIDGTITSALQVNENQGYSVSVTTDESVSNVMDEYEAQLADDGWTISGTMNFGTSATVVAEKGNRSVSVSASEDEDENNTLVVISTSQTEE